MNESIGPDRSSPSDPGAEWVPTPEHPWRPIPDGEDGDNYQYDYGAD
jgi:hypothetical protein